MCSYCEDKPPSEDERPCDIALNKAVEQARAAYDLIMQSRVIYRASLFDWTNADPLRAELGNIYHDIYWEFEG